MLLVDRFLRNTYMDFNQTYIFVIKSIIFKILFALLPLI